MAALGIKTGDTVEVVSGKDRGKRGKVLSADPRTERVVVEGRNLAKRHTKPRQSSSSSSTAGPSIQPGGILDVAQPMDVSKVMLVCPKCDRPTRIKHSTLADGKRIRVCGHCGSPLEVKA